MSGFQKLGIAGAAGLVLVFAIYLAWPRYGALGERGYALARAIDSAASRQDTETFARLRELVTEALDEQAITTAEANWLDRLISQGEAGRWEQVRREVRKLLAAQQQTAGG
ncbi:MAG: hypothetical protein KDA83_04320 [Planctomycetales bacterium]|nr:hypothetical protein [Planctomycetales bacterium]